MVSFIKKQKIFAEKSLKNPNNFFLGLIDALEIFSGLIIFAEAKAEDKLRFLFDLFDFNEI